MTKTREYLEPILHPLAQLADPVVFQGGNLGFEYLRVHARDQEPSLVHALDVDAAELEPFTKLHNGVPNITPQIMGIVNVTPDSFSDGGLFANGEAAVAHARSLVERGADILDFGAESTRPGAETVPVGDELQRLETVFDALDSFGVPTSIDTRKAAVAEAGLDAGALMINDVSAMSFDPDMLPLMSSSDINICLMHALGDPKTMQDNPEYNNVLLDVYDYLEGRIQVAKGAYIDPARIVVDPGIGFGKTTAHNIALLRHIALFHGLGVPILVGASRKRLIKELGGGDADQRLGGSVSVALDLARKGVQIIRVHDVFETVQAMKLQQEILGK